MDPEAKKFGRGPRELTGAVDLISHYKLLPHHDFFCKRGLPISISETHYLHNVVGDTEIRKGEGMELDQLFENHSYLRETTANIRPFDLDTLSQAFQLRETAPIELPSAEKGLATISGKVKYESKDKERKHKKHKDKDREKDKEHKKHKHRHKDRSKDKDKDKDKDREKKDKSGHHDSGGSHSKKHHDKKRKHDGSEDLSDTHKHKKNKEFCRPGLSMDPAYPVSQPDSNMLWMQTPPGLCGGSNQTEPLIGVTANRDSSNDFRPPKTA